MFAMRRGSVNAIPGTNKALGCTNTTLALIVPYFGQLPNYYQLWLDSCGDNQWVDFFVPSDLDFSSYRLPANVHVIAMSFLQIQCRLTELLDFMPPLDPYKLTDCKPLYALIFPELVEGYEWWGYCDCDLIFGDLGHFLPAPLAGDCERVYRHGHLTILRNRVDVNRVALNNLPGVRASWRDVFRHKCSAHYDESLFFEALLKDAGLTTFEEVTYADLDRFELRFRMREGNELLDVDHFEKRSDGVLLAQMAQGGVRELSYVHFQWRAMGFTDDFDPTGGYQAYPNVFANKPVPAPAEEDCARYKRHMHEKHRKRQLDNLLHGNLFLRAKGYNRVQFKDVWGDAKWRSSLT